jgi:hypothetical protein
MCSVWSSRELYARLSWIIPTRLRSWFKLLRIDVSKSDNDEIKKAFRTSECRMVQYSGSQGYTRMAYLGDDASHATRDPSFRYWAAGRAAHHATTSIPGGDIQSNLPNLIRMSFSHDSIRRIQVFTRNPDNKNSCSLRIALSLLIET